MKIVCGSCQAKYSIADEKVAGKVFKIRCKRCSEVIVVRGDQEPAPEAQTTTAGGFDASADAIWHVVINGEQAGPYAPAQMAEMLTSGHIDWEAYVWTEGFENWAPMRDVPDLVAAITGQAQPQQTAAGGFSAQPSMGADPFADEATTAAVGGMFSAPMGGAAAIGGGNGARSNLFGGGDSPFDASDQVVASAPSPRVSAEQAMTGSRNENSVLFSLKNLQALATGSSTAAAAPSGGGLGGGMGGGASSLRPGFAGGEGSGLIDIRALATATGVGDSGRDDEKDALLSLGSAQTGAFGALGSPMLAPSSSDDGGSNKGLMLAIFGGLALVAVAGVAMAVILRPQAPVAAPVAAVMPAPAVAAAAAVNPAPAAAAAPSAEPPSEGELAAKRAAAAPGSEEDKHSSGGSHTAKHHEAGDKTGGAAEPATAHSDPLPTKSDDKPKAKGGSSSIDELLDGAISGNSSAKASAKKAEPAADSNLPDKPSRDDVISAMNSVKDPVKACAGSQTGVAFANITVSGKTGRVSGAEISGITGEAGSCIARAVRKATFPKFKSESFQVKFPFRL